MPINKTLLSKDQIKNLTVDWGTIQGSISNQTDLLALLNTKSDIDHNHDDLYLPINGTAADAAMLDGKLPSYYTTAQNITYDNSISGLAATNMQSVVDEIITILPTSGEEPEFTIREIIKNTSGTLTTSDVMGTFINNLGQNGNIELTLPEATEGLSFVVMMGSSSPYQFKLIANANDRIYLQTQHSIYGGFVGLTSTNKCDTAIVNTFKTGDKYEWLVLPFLGTWTINTGTLGKISTTVTPLSVARSGLVATSVGNYALFGGGGDAVDAYDTSLTRTTPTPLSVARSSLAATTVGNYALFGGGGDAVDAYDTSLTRTTPTPLSVARSSLAATTVGNYALFGGGNTDRTYFNVVDAYDTSLTRTTPTALSVARNALAATTVGNYALFGGGYNPSSLYSNVVDAYDTSLTRTTPTPLSVARRYLAATTVGDYALFGGGNTGGTSAYSNRVDAYNTSLTRTTPTALSVARHSLAATTVGNYALFGGGHTGTSTYSNVVDAYDTSLTRTTPTALSVARSNLAATTVGNYALFGGGSNVVDAYYVF
jgi:hypothetical protein